MCLFLFFCSMRIYKNLRLFSLVSKKEVPEGQNSMRRLRQEGPGSWLWNVEREIPTHLSSCLVWMSTSPFSCAPEMTRMILGLKVHVFRVFFCGHAYTNAGSKLNFFGYFMRFLPSQVSHNFTKLMAFSASNPGVHFKDAHAAILS